MIVSILMGAFLGAMQTAAAGSAVPQSPTEIANATKFDVIYDGNRVRACTVTATSWNAQVDRYFCDAARFCGDHFKTTDQRAACLATKRQELADQIAKSLGPGKSDK